MQEKGVQLIKISEMTPNVLPHSTTNAQKPLNIVNQSAPNDVVIIEEKYVDLVSVKSEELQEDDTVSFDEGRLQQWNGHEFRAQFASSLAGIILLFGCASISAWAIADFLKDMQVNGDDWIDVDYEFAQDEEFFQSRHVIIAMVVLSWNIGYIIGGVFGAFIVPILPNRTIYVSCLGFFTLFRTF